LLFLLLLPEDLVVFEGDDEGEVVEKGEEEFVLFDGDEDEDD
jgi:hypothetical protein